MCRVQHGSHVTHEVVDGRLDAGGEKPKTHPGRPPQRFAWAPRGLAAPWAVRLWATAPSVSLSL